MSPSKGGSTYPLFIPLVFCFAFNSPYVKVCTRTLGVLAQLDTEPKPTTTAFVTVETNSGPGAQSRAGPTVCRVRRQAFARLRVALIPSGRKCRSWSRLCQSCGQATVIRMRDTHRGTSFGARWQPVRCSVRRDAHSSRSVLAVFDVSMFNRGQEKQRPLSQQSGARESGSGRGVPSLISTTFSEFPISPLQGCSSLFLSVAALPLCCFAALLLCRFVSDPGCALPGAAPSHGLRQGSAGGSGGWGPSQRRAVRLFRLFRLLFGSNAIFGAGGGALRSARRPWRGKALAVPALRDRLICFARPSMVLAASVMNISADLQGDDTFEAGR